MKKRLIHSLRYTLTLSGVALLWMSPFSVSADYGECISIPAIEDAYAITDSGVSGLYQHFSVLEDCSNVDVSLPLYVAGGSPTGTFVSIYDITNDTFVWECFVETVASGFGEYFTVPNTDLDSCISNLVLHPDTEYSLNVGTSDSDTDYYAWGHAAGPDEIFGAVHGNGLDGEQLGATMNFTISGDLPSTDSDPDPSSTSTVSTTTPFTLENAFFGMTIFLAAATVTLLTLRDFT